MNTIYQSIQKVALCICGLFVISSCADFIEHEQRGTQTLDNYFKTADECEFFVNDLYRRAFLHYDWYQIIPGRMANEMASDDAWMGNTGQNASDAVPAAQYLITPNRMGYLRDLFRIRYENITACNVGIEGITKAPIKDALKERLLGEALFMRAYNYYDLVNNFGGVPLALDPLSTNDMNKARSTKEEVYTQIETDLAVAIAKLSDKTLAKGRVTQWACYSLLSRVHLFQSEWQLAYDYANKVITEGPYSLENSFLDVWNVNNPNGKESILEAQTSAASDKKLGNQLCTFSGARFESKDNFPSKDDKDAMGGWGWGVPTSDLENVYLSEKDDIRRKSTITKSGEPAYGDETLNPTHIFALDHNKSGRVIRKYYIPVTTRRTLVNKQLNAPLNVPIIRLAEMYLTRAETAYHLNKPDEAMDDVDFIRARVKLSPKKGKVNGSGILYAIWKERRMELAFEGLRLFDIRRQIDPLTNKPVIQSLMGPNGSFVKYNTVESTDKNELSNIVELQNKGILFDASKHMLWPIPQSEIDRSMGVITQNPNY